MSAHNADHAMKVFMKKELWELRRREQQTGRILTKSKSTDILPVNQE